MNNRGKIAILQIMILLFGIIAFSYLVSGKGLFSPTPWNERTGSSTLSKVFNVEKEGAWDATLSGLQWAAVTYGIVQMLGPTLGLTDKETDALSISLAAGIGLGKGLSVATKITTKVAGWIGVGVVVVLLILLPAKGDTYTFSCKMWDAPVGGRNCHLCNNQKTSEGVNLPCSEYQCKSLGQACELVNKGTGKEKCVAINTKDTLPPVTETDSSVLPQGYSYTPNNAINPPDRGVKVLAPTSDHCLPAFTPISIGIKLNEVAKCKADKLRGKNFSEMAYYLSNGLSLQNHTINLSLPGVSNLEQDNITLENGGDFELYVKCQDFNGNSNDADFVFDFCVQKGPDNMPPEIIDTSVLNNMPIAVGEDNLPLLVYVNEPAECKWSTEDKSYESMENQMDCEAAKSTEQGFERNGRLVYVCNTTLTGLVDKQENKFYFRCKDQPKLKNTDRESDRNTNSQSYAYTLIGTQPLVIDKAGPSGEVTGSTENVKVVLTAETSAGYKDGEANCYFREKGASEDFVQFFNTGGYNHSTELHLPEGNYEYYIKCVDLGGNSDVKEINFSVKSDMKAPEVTRLYKSENSLKIITDEKADCVYDSLSCNYVFENGIPITADSDKRIHSVDWNVKTKFYVKCRDDFGNEPNPDECSVIVKAL